MKSGYPYQLYEMQLSGWCPISLLVNNQAAVVIEPVWFKFALSGSRRSQRSRRRSFSDAELCG